MGGRYLDKLEDDLERFYTKFVFDAKLRFPWWKQNQLRLRKGGALIDVGCTHAYLHRSHEAELCPAAGPGGRRRG